MLKKTSVSSKTNTLNLYWGIKKIQFGYIGDNVRISLPGFFGNAQNIFIESNVFIDAEAYFDALSDIMISSGTMIGPRCTFIGSTHNYDSNDLKSLPYDNVILDRKIIVDKNVWIAAGVMICPGTHIGEGSVIGAGACIYGDIPPFSVIVSNRYRIVKERNREKYQELYAENALYNTMFAGTPFIKRNH